MSTAIATLNDIIVASEIEHLPNPEIIIEHEGKVFTLDLKEYVITGRGGLCYKGRQLK